MSVTVLRPTAVVHPTDRPPLSFLLRERPVRLLPGLSREVGPCSAKRSVHAVWARRQPPGALPGPPIPWPHLTGMICLATQFVEMLMQVIPVTGPVRGKLGSRALHRRPEPSQPVCRPRLPASPTLPRSSRFISHRCFPKTSALISSWRLPLDGHKLVLLVSFCSNASILH